MENFNMKSFLKRKVILSVFVVLLSLQCMQSVKAQLIEGSILMGAGYGLAKAWKHLPYVNDKKRADTLIVTSNYANPRLLAELVQLKTHHPIIILPASQKSNQFYYLGTATEAFSENMANLKKFITILNPVSILILGDENYVNNETLKILSDVAAPITVKAKDWDATAKAVENILKLRGLTKEYLRLSNKLLIYSKENSSTPNDNKIDAIPSMIEQAP